MTKQWIKIQQQLINLNDYSSIDEPFYIQGQPGFWQINFIKQNNTVGSWTFHSEHECKTIYKDIVSLLTNDQYKFIG